MNSKTEEMLNRTFQFAVDTLKFLNALPPTTVNKVIINQLAKAATSIGANYEELQAAESRVDFIHKTCLPSLLQKSVSNLRGCNTTNDVSTSKVVFYRICFVQHALPAGRLESFLKKQESPNFG